MIEPRRVVLVTGARGFLGSFCLPLLVERGFEVVAVSSVTKAQPRRGVIWRRCDLLDHNACKTLLDDVCPTHLLHLAWITQPGVFWSSHENLAWLGAGIFLADRFFESGGQRFVGLGSCAEYEITDSPCVEDNTTINPSTVYGKAKAAMHLALQAAAQDRGSYAWGRLFFPYGPGEAGGRFIPSLISGLLAGQPVDCTHGTQERDFVFVADAAQACVALLQSDTSGAYNIGSGAAISLRQIAEGIIQQLGRRDLVRFGTRTPPAFDPPRIAADISKIRHEIGWTPGTTLEDGLVQSIEALKRGSPAPSAKH